MYFDRQITLTDEKHVIMTGLEFLKLKDRHKRIIDKVHEFAHYYRLL
jgi:hypothetical protein